MMNRWKRSSSVWTDSKKQSRWKEYNRLTLLYVELRRNMRCWWLITVKYDWNTRSALSERILRNVFGWMKVKEEKKCARRHRRVRIEINRNLLTIKNAGDVTLSFYCNRLRVLMKRNHWMAEWRKKTRNRSLLIGLRSKTIISTYFTTFT